MSTKYYNATELVESVLLRAMLPKTNNTFTKDDILRFANEELDNALVPFIMQHHEDYFLTYELTQLESGRPNYPIPYRAIGNKLNDLAFQDIDDTIYEMTRVVIADEYSFKSNYYNPYGRYFLRHFYVEGDEIVVASKASEVIGGGYLKFSYYLRPNQIVDESRYTKITKIEVDPLDANKTILTLSNYPENFPLSAEDVAVFKFDLIKNKTPFKTLDFDLSFIEVDNSGTLPIVKINTSDVPKRLEVNDYVCQAEEAPIAQIPSELHSMLAQRVACRCLEALGDAQGLQSAMVKLQEMETRASTMVDSRVESAPLKVINKHGFLNYRRRTPYGGI